MGPGAADPDRGGLKKFFITRLAYLESEAETFFYNAAKGGGRFEFSDHPELFHHFADANRIEEDLQHNLPPGHISRGTKACLRGLWHGRSRKQAEDAPVGTRPPGVVIDGD